MSAWLLAVVSVCLALPPVPSTSPTVTPTQLASSSPTATRTPSSSFLSNSPSPSASISPESPLSGQWCQRDACVVGSCQVGGRCCGGFCISDQYLPMTIPIGGTCDGASYADACTLCQPGLSCDSGTSTCMVFGIGFGCTATCASNLDCVSGLQCTSANRCGYTGLSVGAACDGVSAICAAGLSCLVNICTAIALGGACVSTNLPPNPNILITPTSPGTIDYLSGGCVETAYCSSSVCAAKLVDGSACTADMECLSNLCNSLFCASFGSVPSQGACSNDIACQTGLFCGGWACQPRVAQGERCTQSTTLPYTVITANSWCQSGLICSAFDNVRPVCMPGNVAPGGACYNSDQCSFSSSFGCLQSAPGFAGVCSGHSGGLPCVPGNTTWCGVNNCGACSVTDGTTAGSNRCDPAQATNPCLTLANAAVAAMYAGGYGRGAVLFFDALALSNDPAVLDPVLAYACCAACANAQAPGILNSIAAMVGRPIDCLTTPPSVGPAWSGTTLADICAATSGATGQTVAVSLATLIGGCPSASVSPSRSPSRSAGSTSGASGSGTTGGALAASIAASGLTKEQYIAVIAAPVGGGMLLLALAIGLGMYCCKKRADKRRDLEKDGYSNATPQASSQCSAGGEEEMDEASAPGGSGGVIEDEGDVIGDEGDVIGDEGDVIGDEGEVIGDEGDLPEAGGEEASDGVEEEREELDGSCETGTLPGTDEWGAVWGR